jgi:diguanylate cyclase (GGDEF)-like protein
MRFLEGAISKGSQEPFAVVLLDLNHFKDINDTLGHAAGDRVLEEIGRRLKDLLRDEDACVARLGGDELVVFARRADIGETLEALYARVQACLGRTILMGGVELDITASMGAALYPQDARTPSELLRCADIAMYSAKGDLRPYSRYSELMDNFTPEMLALKSEFAKALREGGVTVVYQPKVRLSDGALIGLEALSRWTHPTMGAVPPEKYVHLAESTELIHPLTLSVLSTVVEQAVRWRAAGHSVPISVNISANNLLDHTFVDKLSQVLRSAGLPAHLLELEVTESAVMRHPDTMLKRLHAIRELGVQLSIDDFGTGYASLSYLKKLPVHTLKIDRSFIINLAADEADQRIVRSSIQLAHGFGMTVVAEGVESEAVAERLREYGCEYAQGFHYARPLAAREIEAHWIRRCNHAA